MSSVVCLLVASVARGLSSSLENLAPVESAEIMRLLTKQFSVLELTGSPKSEKNFVRAAMVQNAFGDWVAFLGKSNARGMSASLGKLRSKVVRYAVTPADDDPSYGEHDCFQDEAS